MEPWWELTPASKAVPRERLAEAAQVSRTVQQYLAELEQQNPLADPEETQTASKTVSTHRSRRRLDGGEEWACVAGLYDNCLIDTHSRVF